jgi:hypothetical protein
LVLGTRPGGSAAGITSARSTSSGVRLAHRFSMACLPSAATLSAIVASWILVAMWWMK